MSKNNPVKSITEFEEIFDKLYNQKYSKKSQNVHNVRYGSMSPYKLRRAVFLKRDGYNLVEIAPILAVSYGTLTEYMRKLPKEYL